MRAVPHRLITEAVDEVRYLAAGTATQRYRVIMRYFYEQHLLHHYALPPAQVLAQVREIVPDYSEDECLRDLKSLEEWKNLDQDAELGLASVRTIEDFKRKNVLYSITPAAVAIEALMVELEKQGRQHGELDESTLSRLSGFVDTLDGALAFPREETGRLQRIHEAAKDLWLTFDDLAESSNNYMGDMRRQERERLLDLEGFREYKEALIQYLTRFVDGLAEQGVRIWQRLAHWDPARVAEDLADSELATVRQFETREHLVQVYREKVESLRSWFAPGGSAEQLSLYASHAIERVARGAHRLSESRRGTLSRAQDLLALADRFQACSYPAQAARLAAAVFGLTHPRHWQLELPEQCSDRPEGSAWQAPPLDTVIRQRRVLGPRHADLQPGAADLAQKQAMLRARERQRQQETAALVARLFADGPLVLGQTVDLAPEERDVVLGWVYECLASTPGFTCQVADGSAVRITNPEERRYVWLVAEDGRLLVPDFRLERCNKEAVDAPVA